jgi:hypothetical protein
MSSHARRLLQAARLAALFTIPLGCMALTACAGDDSNPALPGTDSGAGDATASGSSSGGSSSGSSSGSLDGSTDSGHHFDGGGCDKQPTLHAAGSAGPYCPFIDGGEGSNCASDQLCCLDEVTSDNLVGSCETTGTCAAPTTFYFQCSGPSNCSAPSAQNDAGLDGGDAAAGDAGAQSAVCCGIGPAPQVTTGCPSYDLETDLSATVCATSCAGLDDGGAALIICDTATGECPAGMTCTPFRTHGSELGYCM